DADHSSSPEPALLVRAKLTSSSPVKVASTLTGGVVVSAPISLAVSTVIFALRPHPRTRLPVLWVPLVRRIRQPHKGRWALPGGPLGAQEGLSAAAARTLQDTTRLSPRYLEQLYAFGGLDRAPTTAERTEGVALLEVAGAQPGGVLQRACG